MIRKRKDMTLTLRPNIRDGVGVIHCLNVVEKEELIGKTSYFARMSFQPGESIGEHPHKGNVEFYYILSGCFVVTEEGQSEQLSAGDVAMTGNGASHSIVNTGDSVGELLAIIIDD